MYTVDKVYVAVLLFLVYTVVYIVLYYSCTSTLRGVPTTVVGTKFIEPHRDRATVCTPAVLRGLVAVVQLY